MFIFCRFVNAFGSVLYLLCAVLLKKIIIIRQKKVTGTVERDNKLQRVANLH